MAKIPKSVECPICGNNTTFASHGGISNCIYCNQRFIALYDIKKKIYVVKPKFDFTQEEIDDIVKNRKWKIKNGKMV